MESDYRRQIEDIAKKRNGGGVSNDELFDLILAGFRDNGAVHSELVGSLGMHCTDPNAHQELKNQDVRKATEWVRDKMVAPLVIAIILIVINLVTIR